ncbi:carbamoyl-phosphate synthase large subunit [Pumilibacter muris]|uniref:carbamoyl-phosphate synthase large subunit n=1 Tax=Pumilibacter muris TaxID=2941510 RepID=UPI00203C693E|nr:carbamoyl-phosphate synthase large subunit [Pumilibacter muris]
MPKNKDIKKVLVIGSGPITIGQAAEFDYAGTQACRTLKAEKIEVVLVNSNPATIMTDKAMADSIYIEPLNLTTLERIIELEKPDSLLPSLGGQTGLTLSMQLAKSGFLESKGVKLLGMKVDTIDRAEDRQMFKDTMLSIGQPVVPSLVVTDVESAVKFASEIGYPIIIRPAFTLGGAGGGIAENENELREITKGGLELSPIGQVLVEKSIYGWKEIEFEVMRDDAGNAIAVCSMENLDPVGIHTGDSIVVAPTVTLADKEFQMLRSAALNIISALDVVGGCNCQFALNPNSFEYAVIEVNPRVSRSSALASKATGYPIAKVATLLALGYTLDEIPNAVTKKTCACFEPTLDYVVVKLPKWPFDKFVYAKRTLGTQMKATGEVMAIAPYFEAALLKAVRGAENLLTLKSDRFDEWTDEQVFNGLMPASDYRLFLLFEALWRGYTVDAIAEKTKIDKWFLNKIGNLVRFEKSIAGKVLDSDTYIKAKRLGYPDKAIEAITGKKQTKHARAVYKMVDTCGAEFKAETPYFYSTYDSENEATAFMAERKSNKRRVIVFGSGPIRIGQGIEFDYASVHCVWALKEAGYEVAIVNNNPETVSTDFDTADRLYFEPLTPEDVDNVIATEKPYGVVVAFGGQTAIKLTKHLSAHGVRILGTSADSIDRAEDRERFDALLEELQIARPKGVTVKTTEEALAAGASLGYPVLMRPSYVLGGQNMIIAFSESDIKEYMKIILAENEDNNILIDKYIMGTEIEVDAICDGDDILIPGIMEHIERAGIHSGDSIAVYPAHNVTDAMRELLVEYTHKLAKALNTKGLVNIQYIISDNRIYVIEVNPRSSRTIPYISKVTGVPMIQLATLCMLGKKLNKLGYGTGLYKTSPYVAVKVPIFSFEKLADLDTHLGPEMKSTGEVLGIGKTLDEALYKGLLAAGYKMQKSGGILISVRDTDKPEIADVAKAYSELGYEIYATEGTAQVIRKSGFPVTEVKKISECAENNTMTLLSGGKIDLFISTSTKGRIPTEDDVRLRRRAVSLAVPCLTSIDTAKALAFSLKSRYSAYNTELVNINDMRTERQKLNFIKMQGCGNDYIYIDCLTRNITNMESVAVNLSDRHFGVGGDGAVFICPSAIADAKMRMFNSDGTEGMMCGNAIRCVAKYLYDYGKIGDKREITIETKSGVKKLWLFVRGGHVNSAKVDMGAPALAPSKIPVKLDGDKIVARKVKVGGAEYEITCVSMGNPHCVLFVENAGQVDVAAIGKAIECDPLFPKRVNVEFVQIIDRTHLKMRVWERGSGETYACGTGACAAVVAAVLGGHCDLDAEVSVRLLGGELSIRYTDETVFMTGEACEIFKGVVRL